MTLRNFFKTLGSFSIVLAILLVNHRIALAIDCNYQWFAPEVGTGAQGNLRVDVGGFTSLADINNTIVHYECLGNSNAPDAGICRDVRVNDLPLSSLGYSTACVGQPGCTVGSSGTNNGPPYYVTPQVDISRAVGKMRVLIYQGTTVVCSTPIFYTRPADWDVVKEGLLYQSPTQGPALTCANGKGINTALGCINTSDFGGLVSQILTIAIGIGGGAALLLMAYGVFIITTSTGIPDKINEGKNIITAAAGGLVFIVLSVILFKVLGVDVLGLPGLQ